MKQIKKWMQGIADSFMPKSMEQGLVAAVLSILSVFTFLVAICPGWYQGLPIYSELITGVTTFSGYDKTVDMQIVKVVLWGIPVFFFVFCGVCHFLQKKLEMEQQWLVVTLAEYVLWLVSIINGQKGCLFYSGVLLLWLVGYIILKGVGNEKLCSWLVGSLLAYVAFQSMASVGFSFILGHTGEVGKLVYGIPVVCTCLWALGSAVLLRKKKISMEKQIGFWQLLIPVGLLPMTTFQYYYETTGENFLLFYSSRYKLFVYGVVFVAIVYGVYAFVKAKKGVYPTTIMAVAMLRSFTMPEGILNIDFFHMGEMSTPFMQLQEYGKLPFFDLMPIHGLCDYYYSVIGYLFLDNTYLAMNGAMTIGNLLLAAILALVIYLVSERKESALLFAYCFVPFLCQTFLSHIFCTFSLVVFL